jgi:hypothetical protein
MAATQSKTLLRSFYRKGFNSWRKGVDEAPYAFAIAPDQGDPMRVAQLIARLQSQHIEVHRSNAAFTVKEGSFGAGTYLVRLDQPYRNYAVDLLTPQDFPKNGGEPYDDVSWELPAHYHVTAVAIADPTIKVVARGLDEAPQPRGKVAAAVRRTAEGHRQEGLLEARYRLAKFKIEIAERAFKVGDTEYPAGSWILPAQAGLGSALQNLDTHAHSISIRSRRADVATSCREGAAPWRVGPWADTDSIGWLRTHSTNATFPYSYVRDEDIRAGNLRAKYDVLLYGHVDLELAEQIHGLPKAWGPMPFKKTKQTPSHGTPASSDDITGGIGWEGLAEIQKFVESGGVLVTLGSGTMLALEGGIVRGVRRDSGGVPRSAAGGGTESAQAAVESVTRTPGRTCASRSAARSSDRVWLSGAHVCVPQNYPLYADAPPLAAHGLLHDVSRRTAGSERCRDAMGRPRQRRAVPHQRPGVGRIEPDRASGDLDMPSGADASSRSTSTRCIAISIAAISGCCGTRS